eukprot:m.33709 g.33709  ORF g.33709 m.33709 type:complete len:53 (-) comp16858_c0_seq1:399-557(-)
MANVDLRIKDEHLNDAVKTETNAANFNDNDSIGVTLSTTRTFAELSGKVQSL